MTKSKNLNMHHLIDIKSLSKNKIEEIFETANTLRVTPVKETQLWHQGKSAMALFFENSTRTLTSFQLACQRLGVDITALNIARSSTQKGETIKDTMETLNAMQTDVFIVRHQKNQIQQEMVTWKMVNCDGQLTRIINAGDGTNQHPTQGLLDLFTIAQHKKEFNQIKVAIIGDIKHSRVANSLLDGLKIMGTTDTQVFGPDDFIPQSALCMKADSMKTALTDADVVVMLRIQKERIDNNNDIDSVNWHKDFGLNSDNLKLAKPDAIVMHPGPMNRGIEISDGVADGRQSVILDQVKNGVLIRQALIHHLLMD